MFASLLDGVLVAGVDGEPRYLFANEAAARIFEVPVQELLVPVSEFPARFGYRELGAEPARPMALRALGGEVVPPTERLITTPSGVEKAIRTSAAPLRDEHGRITGAVILAADISAKKAEEARAREHAAQLQRAHHDLSSALADAAGAAELLEHGDGLIELDRNWVIARVNAAQERTTGRSRADTVGRVYWEVWPDVADPQGVQWREYHRCMQERVPVEFEAHYAPFDAWYAITAHPTRSGGIAVSFRDITARNRAEEALVAEHAFTAAVLDTVANLVVVLDRDGRIVRANRACELATGYGAAELTGRLIFDVLIPESDLPGVRDAFRRLTAGMFPSHHENRWRRKDGSERLLEWNNTCIVDAAGDVKFVIGTGLDITERRRQEERLRESELRFRTLTEAMPQIVCALTPDGRAEYVNPQWTAFSGLDLASTNGAGWSGLLHPDDLAAAADCRRRALKTLAPQEVELRYRAADGTFRWFLSRLAPIARGGRVIRFIGSAMNIEDRKRAEEALRETDRRRTEFLGVLSHELRNPLAPIRNGIHILEMAPEGPQASRAREVVRRQTEHLTRLVDDLLDATRISRGKVQLHREVLDLGVLLRRTCEDHRSMFADADIHMSLDLPTGPVWADVDPTRIAQVIGNLLHNAHKFTQPGGSVTVRLRGRGGHAEVSVRDDGAGIEPGQVARMFEPFAQEDRSLGRARGGLGLGLALSKGLVELHGGAITARSEGPGKGSEFTISLPTVEKTAVPRPELPGLGHARVRRRVLVIEDNADAARTLADVLELDGHEVTVARNGTVGVHLAREVKPDVVICDLGLPDLDGYEVARTLRADDSLHSTRLIALTGYAQPEDIDRALEAGFDAHLPKPAPLERLDSLLAADQGAG